MKLYYVILLITGAFFLNACNSESTTDTDGDTDMRKIYKGEKIGFFTEEMDFNEEEAQRFWPIFHAYREKRDSIWRAQKRYLKEYTENNNSEKGSAALQQYLNFDKAKDELQREYVEKLQAFMTDERILQLFYTEYQFKHFMLNRIRGRHRHGEGRGRGMRRGGGNHVDRPEPPIDACVIMHKENECSNF